MRSCPFLYMAWLVLISAGSSGIVSAEERAVENEVEADSGIVLRVRAIRAHGLMEKKSKQAIPPKIPRGKYFVVDEELNDLEYKLQALPYRSYRLIASREVALPVEHKQSLRLQGGQTLNLRLLYADKTRVGMWLGWLDKSGGTLLDTRVHFNRAEPMLAGTDSSKKCGMLLALEVKGK